MKKRKIFLGIITAAIAVCLALCVFMSACTVKIEIEANDDTSSGTTDGGGTSSGGSGDNSEGPEHTHSYDVLKYDDEYHWYECSCGEASPDAPVAHSSTKGYTYDDDSHWQVCDVCNQKFGMEAHDLSDGECVCGYKPAAHEHSYTQQNSDENSHWYECPDDGEVDESTIEAHDSATYGSDDTYHWTECSVCGYKTGAETQHSSEGSEWITSSSSHWHVCVCGYKLDEAAHTYSDEGLCTVCGYQKPAELGETTVYMVGDSTMCSFNDDYYYPRYGYGTQVPNYLDEKATVVNLAMSGRSSKSFLTESNYTTLTSSIGEGDYLIIGFGHNDEKIENEDRYTSPELDAVNIEGSFQKSLYDNYVGVALAAGATPILCTPIVRANKNNNYSGTDGHIYDYGDGNNGDYAECIRDLAEDYNITCIDLTSLTRELYLKIGYDEAIYYHAWTSNLAASVDTTHLNIYGAKEVAYLFASTLATTNNALGNYVLGEIKEPTKEADLVANPNWQPSEYEAPDLTSSEWQSRKQGTYQNVDWYWTAFGDTGGDPTSSSNGYTGTFDTTAGKVTLGQNVSSKGRITDGSDCGSYIFTQLDAYQEFDITATATITMADYSSDTGKAMAKQSGFGIMLRDDIYAPTNDKTILTNYVASGLYIDNSSGAANTIYWRVDNDPTDENTQVLTKSGLTLSSVPIVGDTLTISLSRSGGAQNTACTIVYGGTTYTYQAPVDFDYRTSDYQYTYLCFYAARGTIIEFTDINLTLGNIATA